MKDTSKQQFRARVKEIKVRTLVSGDKEGVLDLRIVGERNIAIASQLTLLPPEAEIEIQF